MAFHVARRTPLRTLPAAVLALSALLVACRDGKTTARGSAAGTDSVHLLASRGTVEVLNGTPFKGAAGDVAERLRAQGFDVVKIGNAPDRNHARTLVVERRAGAATAAEVARALGLQRAYPYRNENLLVDATVFVGRDIQETLP